MSSDFDNQRMRKHIETQRAIELAAVELASTEGKNATVNKISKKANVSRRTFFNYYCSKEDAMLGISKNNKFLNINQNGIIFRPDEDVIEFVVRVMLEIIKDHVNNAGPKKCRSVLVENNPQLLEKQIESISAMFKTFSDTMYGAISSRKSLTHQQTDVLLAICGSTIKIVVKEWVKQGKKTPYSDINKQVTTLIKQTIGEIYG